MTQYAVVVGASFREELSAHWAYIALEAGDAIADSVIDLIGARCSKLASFPHRGTPRDDLSPGVRTIGIRRSVTIAYVVEDRQVTLLHAAFRGQDLQNLFG